MGGVSCHVAIELSNSSSVTVGMVLQNQGEDEEKFLVYYLLYIPQEHFLI